MIHEKPILVLGATGYVGGRLIKRLLLAGYKVRVASRSIEKLKSRSFYPHENLETVKVDVMEVDSLENAIDGCDIAYYLVHSLHSSSEFFDASDREGARNMVYMSDKHGLKRIIYLGGLGDINANLSKHLRSRVEVGDILQTGDVKTTRLRAAMILGSGSASFEMMRYIVDRLPIMFIPRCWSETLCQPISIRNVLNYLVGCLDNPGTTGKTLDIGGPEILTYKDLLILYSHEAGLGKRIIFVIPSFFAKIFRFWIQVVTPIEGSIVKPLSEGLANIVICKSNEARELIRQELLSCKTAIHLALQMTNTQQVETSWSDAGTVRQPEWADLGDVWYAGGSILEANYKVVHDGTIEESWDAVRKIGGRYGWYYGDFLWKIRGLMDKMIGGVGLRRGRRDPIDIRAGDALDFFRAVAVEDKKRLLLVAEMKVPGEAILELLVNKVEGNLVEVVQSARFLPRGVNGIHYWYLLLPIHKIIFRGMLRNIVKSIGSNIVEGPVKTRRKAVNKYVFEEKAQV